MNERVGLELLLHTYN